MFFFLSAFFNKSCFFFICNKEKLLAGLFLHALMWGFVASLYIMLRPMVSFDLLDLLPATF